MSQILDSSEIQEAIRLACKLTRGDSLPALDNQELLPEAHTDGSAELFDECEPVNVRSAVAPRVLENKESPSVALSSGGSSGLTGLADVPNMVQEQKKEVGSGVKSSIIDVTEALSLTSDIERPVRSGPSLQRSEKKMELDLDAFEYRGDKLEEILKLMCQRSNFSGAIVTDDGGLPFAVVNSPVSIEAVSAFASVLGRALERAGELLGQSGAEYLSMDINYEEKVVLRRFMIGEKSYLLLAISPQDVDERGEIEISIEQICEVLTEQK